MKKSLWLVIGTLAVILGASAAAPALKTVSSREAGDVPLYEVRRGDFTRRVHADGNLEAVNATVLGPPPDSQQPLKIAWLAPDGSPVREGDVVIRFDPSDMEKDLKDGRHDRASAASRIEQTTVQEESKQRNLKSDAETATLEQEYAKQFQNKDPEIFSRSQIIESEIDEELAGRRREHAEGARDMAGKLGKTQLGLLDIERRKAELKIEQAQKGLQALEVRAPHDGIFVLKQMWGDTPEVGQVVWGGHPVAEIPRLEQMRAKVYVLEADAGGLHGGLAARVTLDAHPDVACQATVSNVDALAQRRNPRVPIQYFGVILQLDRTDPQVMKPGQRIQADLVLEELHDVLAVPRQAVFEHEGKTVVYQRRSDGFAAVPVKLGPTALGRVVIEEGLAGGERIALADPTHPRAEPESGKPDAETGKTVRGVARGSG